MIATLRRPSLALGVRLVFSAIGGTFGVLCNRRDLCIGLLRLDNGCGGIHGLLIVIRMYGLRTALGAEGRSLNHLRTALVTEHFYFPPNCC